MGVERDPDHAVARFGLDPGYRPGSGTVTSVPSFVGFGDLPSRRLSGSALPTLAICPPAADGGGPRGKRPPPWQSRAQVYADCREGPELRAALHRPGATRHPWRDAPFCGHPDRSPAPFTPPLGPADGFGLG